ncbi:MAG: hypothetical protein ETSY1_41490 [Candidatus Entotheonella factor]|uniref:Uncharacterized protein n=1 Tax=Entotheonella factor TaxID=1429438 RepID=W4L6H1_ENTF1|nr:MAG: hypothetical protein ETSY1_41490 [Candidatus Entotheonella factor]
MMFILVHFICVGQTRALTSASNSLNTLPDQFGIQLML